MGSIWSTRNYPYYFHYNPSENGASYSFGNFCNDINEISKLYEYAPFVIVKAKNIQTICNTPDTPGYVKPATFGLWIKGIAYIQNNVFEEFTEFCVLEIYHSNWSTGYLNKTVYEISWDGSKFIVYSKNTIF